jgi:resuscitation-promoting factor RpfB
MSSQFPLPPEARPSSTPFWKRPWFWAAVAAVLVIAFGANSAEQAPDQAAPKPTAEVTTSPTTTPTPSPTTVEVVVPDVEGQSVKSATKALEAEELAVVVRSKLTDTAREGTVLNQSVEPGATLEAGRAVVLLVAKALPRIPNVVGDKLAAARRTLENRSFEVRVKRETSSRPKDTVIRQSPATGTSARPGRTVLLVVAKPAPPSSGGGSDCTPGYSPCIPPGPDVDCAGGSGDGSRYVSGPIQVTGSDPYGLDGDNDGVGCE